MIVIFCRLCKRRLLKRRVQWRSDSPICPRWYSIRTQTTRTIYRKPRVSTMHLFAKWTLLVDVPWTSRTLIVGNLIALTLEPMVQWFGNWRLVVILDPQNIQVTLNKQSRYLYILCRKIKKTLDVQFVIHQY